MQEEKCLIESQLRVGKMISSIYANNDKEEIYCLSEQRIKLGGGILRGGMYSVSCAKTHNSHLIAGASTATNTNIAKYSLVQVASS